MIGDWGGQQLPPHYTPAQADVAEQMGKKGTEVGANFTLSVGDNFYFFGVADVDDPRFNETFEVCLYQSNYKYITIATIIRDTVRLSIVPRCQIAFYPARMRKGVSNRILSVVHRRHENRRFGRYRYLSDSYKLVISLSKKLAL